MNANSLFCLLGLTVLSAQATPIQYYISPTGSDTTGSGAFNNPWATIGKARDYIRTNGINAYMTDDIIVNLAAGDYLASSPISFTSSDSGSNDHYIVYQAYDGPGTARIVGSASIVGWTAYSGSIWRVNIGTGLALGTMCENDKRARLARSPKYVSQSRYPVSHGPYKVSAAGGNNGIYDWIQYNSGDFSPASWSLSNTAQVIWWQHGGTPDWGTDLPRVFSSVDSANNTIYMQSVIYKTPSNRDRYYVNGIFQLLSSPGEFFYSSSDGWLYYYPQDGNPNAQDIRVALTKRLLQIQGNAIGSHAHHLKFEGLSFAYTNFRSDSNGIDAAIYLQSTDNIQILNCNIHNVGSGAISVRYDNSHDVIYGCWIHNCGVGGVWVVNDLLRNTYPGQSSSFNLISNCKIHDLGEVSSYAFYSVGVLLYSTSDCEVSYCDIFNSSRYAVSLRGHWLGTMIPPDNGYNFAENNAFEYIRATDCLMDSGDAGIVHAATVNGSADPNGSGNINYWNQILLSGAYADPTMADPNLPNGVFLDGPDSCLYQDFANIKIAYTSGGLFRTNGNPTQTTFNVSWTGTFNESLMEYSDIGLKSDFQQAYNDRETVVTDDHSLDYSESDSSWIDTGISGLYKGDGRLHWSGSSAQYVQWRPVLPITGNYEVWVWKMLNDPSATSLASYTIYYNGGSQVVAVSQSSGTSGWVSLGTYAFVAGRSASSGFVRLSAATGDGKAVRADAVKFVGRGLKSDFPQEYGHWKTAIADDHTVDYSESDATWSNTGIPGLYKGDGRLHWSGSSAQYVQWRPVLPITGNYEVWVWKMLNDPSATSLASYTIYYNGGSQVVAVSQSSGTSGWVSLGTYAFVAGRSASSGFVRLSAATGDGKAVRADAVKFIASEN